jgi:hypothetical protein
VGLKSLKSLNLTNGYPNKNKKKKKKNNNNNKVKSKPLELFELAGKKPRENQKLQILDRPISSVPLQTTLGHAFKNLYPLEEFVTFPTVLNHVELGSKLDDNS